MACKKFHPVIGNGEGSMIMLQRTMPAYHSSFGGGSQQVGNMAILPIKTANRFTYYFCVSDMQKFYMVLSEARLLACQ